MQDEDNHVESVQLGESDVESAQPDESDVEVHRHPREQPSAQLVALVGEGRYDEVFELEGSMKKEYFSQSLFAAMTTLDHYTGLYKHLNENDMIPDFLINGDVVLVREAIVKFKDPESNYYVYNEDICRAIVVCFKKGHYERIPDLFEAVHTRYAEIAQQNIQVVREGDFDGFVLTAFIRTAPEENSTLLKRFLCFHGDKFQERYPKVFEAFLAGLVFYLIAKITIPGSFQLLHDLRGQPSLLTSTTFTNGFLDEETRDEIRCNFIRHGSWREAIEEGLESSHPKGGQHLWKLIMEKYPNESTPEYPPSPETRIAVLENFKTKQELENDWTKEHTPMLLKKLESIADIFPIVLWNIVFEYAPITWIITLSWEVNTSIDVIKIENDTDLEQSHPQRHEAMIQKREQFAKLMEQEQYDVIVKLGESMEDGEFMGHLCSVMTELDHYTHLFEYLKKRGMLSTFVAYGNATLVKKAIIEFKRGSIYFIEGKYLFKAIAFLLDQDSHDRVIDVLGAVEARYAAEDQQLKLTRKLTLFDGFIDYFFNSYPPVDNSESIKRFLTLSRKKLTETYPSILDAFCVGLVKHLRVGILYPKAKKLLLGLVGQQGLLTPIALARGFLDQA